MLTSLAETSMVFQPEDSLRYRTIQNAVREHQLSTAFRLLRNMHVEPILLKGWSVGRFYPDPSLRQLGDIDLLVRDEELPTAEKALSEEKALYIDWHPVSALKAEFTDPERIFDRSERVSLLSAEIGVLCPEDSLHLVAIHMLRHAGWSPHWISDLDVLVRSRPASFNWEICLGPDPTRAGWVLTALVVAHELAGVNISGTPAENHRIPDWIVPAVLRGRKDRNPGHIRPPESIWTALAHPWRLPRGLCKRWPNPITAAIRTGAPFQERPPFVHQLRYCASLAGNFVSRAHS